MMIAELRGTMRVEKAGKGSYVVTAEAEDVRRFVSSWPCSRLDEEASYEFTFSDMTGDIIDLRVVRSDGTVDGAEKEDGPDLLALSEDAMQYGAVALSLDDVIAIRRIERENSSPVP